VYCLDQSGVLDGLAPDAWTGDKGYVGRGMVTPIKKIERVELLDWQKAFNGHQSDPRCGRTHHRQPQNLENSPHRLPATAGHVRHNDFRSYRAAVLLADVN
jgi:hypothetical protein